MNPAIAITITSTSIEPTWDKARVVFNYSKAASTTPNGERLQYDVYDSTDSTFISQNNILETVVGGGAISGQEVVSNLPLGHSITITLKLTLSDSSYATAVSNISANTYTPVSQAVFDSIVWDETRRKCSITATASSSSGVVISAGYSPNNYTIASLNSPNESGTLVLSDLNHGSGQILYLKAVPQSYNGHTYEQQAAYTSIPIPNPILGVAQPKCGDGDPQYIIDIVEHKTDGTCTPRWQNGDRLVKKKKCGDEDYLLQENKDYLLQENNDKIIIDE